jgi:hypothetical protein
MFVTTRLYLLEEWLKEIWSSEFRSFAESTFLDHLKKREPREFRLLCTEARRRLVSTPITFEEIQRGDIPRLFDFIPDDPEGAEYKERIRSLLDKKLDVAPEFASVIAQNAKRFKFTELEAKARGVVSTRLVAVSKVTVTEAIAKGKWHLDDESLYSLTQDEKMAWDRHIELMASQIPTAKRCITAMKKMNALDPTINRVLDRLVEVGSYIELSNEDVMKDFYLFTRGLPDGSYEIRKRSVIYFSKLQKVTLTLKRVKKVKEVARKMNENVASQQVSGWGLFALQLAKTPADVGWVSINFNVNPADHIQREVMIAKRLDEVLYPKS